MTVSDAGASVREASKPRHSDIDSWGLTHTGKKTRITSSWDRCLEEWW